MVKLFKLNNAKAGSWYFRVTSNGRRVRICTNTTDKRLAQDVCNQYMANQAKLKNDLTTTASIKIRQHANDTIECHLSDFADYLAGLNRNAEYVKDCKRCITRIYEFNKWLYLRDVSEACEQGVSKWMAQAFTTYGNRTVQKHFTAFNQFVNWLAGDSKLPKDLLARLSAPNPNVDRKVRMRMLLPEEWNWIAQHLLTTTKVYHETSPHDRRLVYETALQTGFRNSELRQLRTASLTVGSSACMLTLEAAYTKNQTDARQYIRRSLATELNQLKKLPEARLLRMPRREACTEMLLKDLSAARVLWLAKGGDAASNFLKPKNDKQEVLKFHSLRHTCGAWMAIAGVNVKAIQSVMRHSTITLTLDTYGHLLPNSEADAVELQLNVFKTAAKVAQ